MGYLETQVVTVWSLSGHYVVTILSPPKESPSFWKNWVIYKYVKVHLAKLEFIVDIKSVYVFSYHLNW